ncbi:DUF58 domain-containing protein [Candidatus Dependentiae bacterium]|nr:DUF58 domain-containing protein [Candidatus Dependentiae bacterium]
MTERDLAQVVQECILLTRRTIVARSGGVVAARRKGFGVEFYQLREYVAGDDVRYIDWKSTSRMGKMMMRECIELQQKSILIVVDCSASMAFGGHCTKLTQARVIAAILAAVAQSQGDEVTVLWAGDTVQTVPVTSQEAALRLVSTPVAAQGIFSAQETVRHILAQRQVTMCIVVSDCIAIDLAALFAPLAARIELQLICITDPLEQRLPRAMILSAIDAEKECTMTIDATIAGRLSLLQLQMQQQVDELCKRYGISPLTVGTEHQAAATLVERLNPLLQFA